MAEALIAGSRVLLLEKAGDFIDRPSVAIRWCLTIPSIGRCTTLGEPCDVGFEVVS